MNHKRYGLFSVAVLLCALAGCHPSQARRAGSIQFGASTDISATDANALLAADDSITYLDVRTVGEFSESHPKGASNIPIFVANDAGAFERNVDFLSVVGKNFDKSAKIIVGCRSGSRSKKAQRAMIDAGFTNVVNMLGGFFGKRSVVGKTIIEGWSQLDLPTESGVGGDGAYDAMKKKAGS